jgi:hypothetical protein
LVLVVLALVPVDTLVIKFNEKVCYVPLNSNFTLTVRYTHSVSLTKIVDVYRVDEKGIYAIQEKWQQFDAGQPLDIQRIEDGYFVKSMNVYLGKSWQYWFIPLNNATVEINGKVVFVQPEEEGILRFEIEKVPAILTIIRGW